MTAHPVVLTVFKWAGAAYLLWFAFTSFRSAMHPQALEMRESSPSRSIVLSALAITLLNPHVYLDTVVMLGNLANQHGPDRWWFTLGACLASLIWFPALGYRGPGPGRSAWAARGLAAHRSGYRDGDDRDRDQTHHLVTTNAATM